MNTSLLKIDEVAEVLAVTPRSVYRILKQGYLPFIRVGFGRGMIRVRSDDLTQYVSGATSSGPGRVTRYPSLDD